MTTAGLEAAAAAAPVPAEQVPCECPCKLYIHLGYCTGTAQTTIGIYSAVEDREYDRRVCQACATATDNVFQYGHPAGPEPGHPGHAAAQDRQLSP